jgi:hypothetical protein
MTATAPFFWFFRSSGRVRFFLLRSMECSVLVSMVFTLAVVVVNFDEGMRLALALMGSGQAVQASSVGIIALNPGALSPSSGTSLSAAVAFPAAMGAVAQLRQIFDAVMGTMLVLLSAWTVVKSRNDGVVMRDRTEPLLGAIARSPLPRYAGTLLLLEVTALVWGTSLLCGVGLSLLVVLPAMRSIAGPTLFEFMFAQIPSGSWMLLALVASVSVCASWRRT